MRYTIITSRGNIGTNSLRRAREIIARETDAGVAVNGLRDEVRGYMVDATGAMV